ncbi:related to Cutl1 or CASP protein [Pseudozyma flocculosa]|uniref:Protein CASP n=1 Tax=Pseudozyma flocculosa TaxID=84751 RepID=A0A5C3F1W0_9BASI|nr:related to Cutl1 or CASP protein [Pseudozyma flocculosa]
MTDAMQPAADQHSPQQPPPTSQPPVPADRNRHSSVDFSTALSIWRDINLTDLQSSLAATAPALLDAQKAAVVNRKKLAEQTRDFKKQPDDAKLDAIKPLLKAYQAEIDTLTKRSKLAENAFLNAHSALVAAPDPYPLLEIVLDQAAALADLDSAKAENVRLRRENAELKASAARRSDGEHEAKRLQQRVDQLESESERRLAERTDAVEKEVSARWDERIRNLQERERDLAQSLRVAQEQLQELKTRDESATARLLEQGQEADDRETRGKLAEIELVSRDLERAQSRVESVERRNEQLRAEIESIRSGRDDDDRVDRLAKELAQREARIAQLQELIESEQRSLQGVRDQAARSADEAAKAQRDREAEVESLRARLARCADYDDIKRELDIVKMVEFSNEFGDDDDDGDVNDNNDERDAGNEARSNGNGQDWNKSGAAKPLEALLLDKNRKLQDQLTSLRVAHNELSTASTASSGELDRLKREVARLQALTEKLENDLVSIGGGGGRSGGSETPGAEPAAARSASASAAMSAEEALAEMDRIAASPSRSSTQQQQQSQSQLATQPTSAGATTPSTPRQAPPSSTPSSGADTSILPIITSQRDRFRARNAELEEELRKQFTTISELRNEIKTLQADNLGLYEKLRYLQTYGGGGNGSGGAEGSNGSAVRIAMGEYPPPQRGGAAAGADLSAVGVARRTSADEKYRLRYEESMNPWERFKGRRLLHMLTRLVLSHRRMRLLFLLYAFFLHAMVFAMLFEIGHSSSTSTCAIHDPSRPT